MKKLILLAAAAAAFAAAGGAMAQGVYWTPECGTANSPQCDQVRPNWSGSSNYHYNPNFSMQQQLPPHVIVDGRYGVPHTFVSPYPPTRRDRDGDGVRNSRDRYPDDPRYR
jgi:hypothetical protein